MVGTAAGSDRRLLERAQAGRRLARVPDARVPSGRLGGVDELAGQRRDAREVAEEVQRRPLGGEDRSERTAHSAEHLLRVEVITVHREPRDRDRCVDLCERLGRARGTGEHARRRGTTKSADACRLGRQQRRRDVTEGREILVERAGHRSADGRDRRTERISA